MKALSILAAVLGVTAIAVLIGYFGAGAVMRSLLAVGGLGFAAICAIHLALMAVMGLAWHVLLPGTPVWTALWGRLVRDSAGEVLPFLQVGGYVLGARALALTGVSGTLAAASTIVDVTLEFVAQLAYTALGLAWLAHLQPDSAAAIPIMIGLAVATVAALAFVLVQRHGFDQLDRIARILGRGWAARGATGAAALHAALAAIYRRRGALWLNFALHLACWIASAVEAWLALLLAGEPLSFGAVLVLESMLYAVRTSA
ncbi:MAG TPA: lysylphosphatidylglycerol synthase domain-containing protein, partial [Stellaceae bacterium]|nr:lysylphosphatidylglycerol synthase domain-containing protein [Stellaceae bacterium]